MSRINDDRTSLKQKASILSMKSEGLELDASCKTQLAHNADQISPSSTRKSSNISANVVQRRKSNFLAPLDEIGKVQGRKKIGDTKAAIRFAGSPQASGDEKVLESCEPQVYREGDMTRRAQDMPPLSHRLSYPVVPSQDARGLEADGRIETSQMFAIPRKALSTRPVHGATASGTTRPGLHRAAKSLPVDPSQPVAGIYYPSRLELLENRRMSTQRSHPRPEPAYPDAEELRAIREDIAERTLRAEESSNTNMKEENRRLGIGERMSRVSLGLSSMTVTEIGYSSFSVAHLMWSRPSVKLS